LPKKGRSPENSAWERKQKKERKERSDERQSSIRGKMGSRREGGGKEKKPEGLIIRET